MKDEEMWRGAGISEVGKSGVNLGQCDAPQHFSKKIRLFILSPLGS